ncbi:hypothetical protein WS71_21915 [Burkholderia mayonis]|uniref:4Fe-4S ferredoxin-type domain-containing protein n=1 Tax=Burkholderia mayonis TaxID=1385591 RepID=A0A1B4G212_9BURK|nr:hypothetical protein WS71_21915 [Burkholderia mayonis]KVE46992.1 hypothetical protein WS71_20115 [Burkholderia mayonis]
MFDTTGNAITDRNGSASAANAIAATRSASLALPGRLRLIKLRRKPECTTCHACAVGCGSQAIDAAGRIDPMECLLCLDCMVMYYDEHSCPPLSKERKRREKAGLPLSPVGKDGRYVPIERI